MTSKIKPLKKFSQNFLQNQLLAEKIVDSLNCNKNDNLLEIGAGKGALTEILFRREYKSLTVVEVDPRLINLLKKKYANKIQIIQSSFINISLAQLAGVDRLKIIGNIPYNITSEIIFKLIENYNYIKYAVLMVQKEVANRLIAETRTKDYGMLTIFTSLYSKVDKLIDVGRENFFPVPKVDSCVIKLEFNDLPDKDLDYALFRKIVKTGFNLRRKKLRNSLNKIFSAQELENISSIWLEKRPEELTLEEFKMLTTELSR